MRTREEPRTREESRECKRSGSRLWKKNKCRSPKIKETRNGSRKRLQKRGKYMAKILYRWDDEKFKKEYLRKLERNW